MSFGGFYKGDKKKPKKDKAAKIQFNNASSGSPSFTLPEIISKKKKSE